MKTELLFAAGLLSSLAAPAAPPADGAPACVIVFGQGRNVAEGDSAANNLWDGVNVTFNAHVAATLENAGERVVPLVAKVTATDVAANLRQALARAAADGCRRIVETSMFADYENRTLVARLRDYPILVENDAQAEAPVLHLGAAGYVNERNFDLNRTTLDRVRPGALAAEMAGEMVRQGIAARALPAAPASP
jgi:hypothetical protein